MGMYAYLTPLAAADIAGLRAQPDAFDHNAAMEQPGTVDIDKMWHLLHYALCGDVGPTDDIVSQAILSGEEIGEDIGYGPARLIAPAEVRAIAAGLQAVTVPDFVTRMQSRNWSEADDVYLQGVVEDEFDELVPQLAELYGELRLAYMTAAKRGDAMLSYLV